MTRQRCRGESGSSLVIALAFLSLFGLFVATLLSFGESSLLNSKEMRVLGDQFYDADGGIEGAINWLRSDTTAGVAGNACPEFQLGTATTGSPVRVTCTPNPGSGEVVGRDTILNTPGHAILTLGTDADEGILVTGPKDLNVEGNVASNGKIALGSAAQKMNVKGDVIAMAGCSANVIVKPPGTVNPPNCASSPAKTDPGYPKLNDPAAPTPGSAAMPWQDLATQESNCNSGKRVISYFPGYYDDAVKLSWLTNGGSSGSPCDKSIHWFTPGTYYFDFNFRATAGSCASSSDTACTWRINLPLSHPGSVIAGTPPPSGTTGHWNPTSPPATQLPFGSCQQSVEDPNNGVQFVFGGESRLAVDAGVVELCAQGSATTQQVILHGVPSGTLSPAAPTVTLATSVISSTNFTNPANAAVPDDSVATASLSSSARTATARLAFPALSMPDGSRIDAAKLTVRHREGTGSNLTDLSLSAAVSGASSTISSATCVSDPTETRLCKQVTSALRDDVINLRNIGLNTREKFTTGLTVDYTASLPSSSSSTATELLDGMTLTVQYTAPGYRRPSTGNCLVKVPYNLTETSTCPLLKVTGNNVRTSLEGTVYTPLTAIDVNLPNESRAFGRGIISRTASINVPNSFTYTGSPLKVPHASYATGPVGTTSPRSVTLVAQVWDARSATYRDRLRSVVEFPHTTSPPSSVDVRSWHVLR